MEVDQVKLVGRLVALRDELARFSGQKAAVDPGRVMEIVQQIDTMVSAIVSVGLQTSG